MNKEKKAAGAMTTQTNVTGKPVPNQEAKPEILPGQEPIKTAVPVEKPGK